MSSLAEIQDAIEKLGPEERAELWDWFQAQEVEETDEMLAAVDEGIRSIEEQVLSVPQNERITRVIKKTPKN